MLYAATGDPLYQEAGKVIADDLARHTRVAGGHASIRDVSTKALEVETDGQCLTRHQTHIGPSFLEANDILGRCEHCPPVPSRRITSTASSSPRRASTCTSSSTIPSWRGRGKCNHPVAWRV